MSEIDLALESTTAELTPRAASVRKAHRQSAKLIRIMYGTLGTIMLIALWQILPSVGIIDRRIIPPPTSLGSTARTMFLDEDFASNIWTTVARAALALLLGGAIGVLVGVVSGLSKDVNAVFGPLIAICFPIPVLILLPLILNALGNGPFGWVVVIGIGPFFTMAISSRAAFADLSRTHLDVAKAFGASRTMTARRVLIPGALPGLLGGARLALGAALLGTISIEYLVTPSGIGQVMHQSWSNLALSEAMVGLAVTAVLALVSFAILSAVERLILPWSNRG